MASQQHNKEKQRAACRTCHHAFDAGATRIVTLSKAASGGLQGAATAHPRAPVALLVYDLVLLAGSVSSRWRLLPAPGLLFFDNAAADLRPPRRSSRPTACPAGTAGSNGPLAPTPRPRAPASPSASRTLTGPLMELQLFGIALCFRLGLLTGCVRSVRPACSAPGPPHSREQSHTQD